MFATDFESAERSFSNRKRTIATATTILIHALIILYLITRYLETPVPPFEDNAGGMAVNFGTDDVGMGDEQPFTYNPGQSAAAPAPQQAQPQASNPEDLLTSEEESDVTATKEDKPKNKVKEEPVVKPTKPAITTPAKPTKTKPVENAPPAPQADPNALFKPGSKGAYGKPNNGSDGTGNQKGDQGDPNGDPNSHNYEGGPGTGDTPGPGGNGNGFSLTGRKSISLPPPPHCNTAGKVVVTIKVDKTGRVVYAKPNLLKSTATDDCNLTNAKNAAMHATFSANENAPGEQEGTITYIYKIQ